MFHVTLAATPKTDRETSEFGIMYFFRVPKGAGETGCLCRPRPRTVTQRPHPMCLGIPMQVQSIDGFTARCEAKGVERAVSLFMMQHEPVAVGDFVVVHVGYAIQRVTEQEARSSWELFDQILEQEEGGGTVA